MRLLALFLMCTTLAAHAQVLPSQVRSCIANGWQRIVVPAAGLEREALWKAPPGPWQRGVILVLHGGGGNHFNFCHPGPISAAQVGFTKAALDEGFAVVLLQSTADRVTDEAGRVCGKAWDDEKRARPNLDLPFIGELLEVTLPMLRPPGSRTEVFMTGLSSGGFMTVRAATHFDDRITAFAPVSSGDPYGWQRDCDRSLSRRRSVAGKSFDLETGKMITERGACRSASYPNERAWDSTNPPRKPAFRVFFHEDDGVVDPSCIEKVDRQLRAHGYAGEAPFRIAGDGRRTFAEHIWLEDYHRPVLGFFLRQLEVRRP